MIRLHVVRDNYGRGHLVHVMVYRGRRLVASETGPSLRLAVRDARRFLSLRRRAVPS